MEYTKVSAKEVLDMLAPIIRDEVIAQYVMNESGLTMQFKNGQSFVLTITEAK